jgi:hypothetical protein
MILGFLGFKLVGSLIHDPSTTSPVVIGIDIAKNSFHIVGQKQRGAIVGWRCPVNRRAGPKTLIGGSRQAKLLL